MKLAVENVSKRFTVKSTPAVFEASFEAADGGITTLLGPSGSGKTTLLRIVAGLEHPDDGRVVVDGQDITRVPVGKRRFGFVFQGFALFPHLTVRDNVAFGLEAQGLRGDVVRKRVSELLALVQLDGLERRFPAQLSGGQRQRVGFARALAPHPKLLLLDEPFGALDARVRVELRAWLRQLHEATQVTTLMVTHDQDEALELSHRIVVMDRGRVHQVGTPREVYDAPRTPFVASFVGTANVLEAQVHEGRATVGAMSLALPRSLPEGASVRAIVRPHDVRVTRTDVDAVGGGVSARVRQVATLGAYVKLALTTSAGDPITVHMPRRQFERMRLVAGDPVLVDLEGARLFVEDYAI